MSIKSVTRFVLAAVVTQFWLRPPRWTTPEFGETSGSAHGFAHPSTGRLTRAYLASAQERPADAIPILTRLQREAEVTGNHYFALRVATHLEVSSDTV